MIEFKTLLDVTIDELLQVFNLSFSDYIVPLRLTKGQLQDKIKNDRVDLSLSVGAFEDGNLIAFILHGYEKTGRQGVAYNAGTGVVPGKRGNHLTVKMYEYILPILLKKNTRKVQLEVITTNEQAIKSYKRIGFKVSRQLDCFKGAVNCLLPKNDVTIRSLENYNWEILQSFWDWQPTWQNSIAAVEKMADSNTAIGIFLKDELIGYLVYSTNSKKVQQFAVHQNHRRKGIGSALFNYISSNDQKDIVIINIEHTAKGTQDFLRSIGMQTFVAQYEMELCLKTKVDQPQLKSQASS